MSVIKQCFHSRFNGGVLLEVDFSQLEIVGVAILSGDDALKNDIRSGRDMHRARAAELFSKDEKDVTTEERRVSKALSFQLQYGAGAKSMAAKNKIPLVVAENFIKLYYGRYSRLKEWQEENIKAVTASRKAGPKRTGLGEPAGVGTLDSPTGRMFSFTEYDAPDFMREDKVYRKGVTTSFSPTQIKNYPSQGFATADVMALFRAELMKLERLYQQSKSDGLGLPVMTVHDSVMFDCATGYQVSNTVTMCKAIAASLPRLLKEHWDIDCDLEFKVEAKVGPTWATMTKYTH